MGLRKLHDLALFVNSMEQEISQTRMFLPTTKELWELVMVTYSDLENSAQIFELKSKIHDIKQGDQVVIKSVMMGGSSSTTIIENSALASTATKAANVAACQGNSKKTGSKGKISCDHYFMRAADQSMHAAAKSPITITEHLHSVKSSWNTSIGYLISLHRLTLYHPAL
ncbi:hypothetical protein CK203_020056 [Vitis vinifera]|uniref:Uncharacterized protein n=1 Tax=Vitis vinifera TaxID=29760 RepID=A0A438J896_VITVI|nr:hypothetical protein CK203_020056 [Vitis vinifera]